MTENQCNFETKSTVLCSPFPEDLCVRVSLAWAFRYTEGWGRAAGPCSQTALTSPRLRGRSMGFFVSTATRPAKKKKSSGSSEQEACLLESNGRAHTHQQHYKERTVSFLAWWCGTVNAALGSRYLTAVHELQHYQVFNECLFTQLSKHLKVGQVSDMLNHRGMQNNRFIDKDNLEQCKSTANHLLN